MSIKKLGNGHFKGIALMLICTVCICAGQFLWKCFDGLEWLLIGFFIYGIGAVAMLCAYRFGNVSTLQPINSISYIMAAVLGYLFFDEKITWNIILGIVFIMGGVIFLAKGENK